ncbi:MAG: tetratricopeptide repeat protein, partial [Geminicoccaceae bacterium]
NAAAEGTEFLIRVNEADAHILMFEGIVLASNEAGELRLGPDDAALIEKGQKPVPEIVIRPRDAVAWAVYVPDVFSDLAAGAEPGAYPVHLQLALKWARENNIPVALRTLDLVPPIERDASHEALRAAILLTVGRFEEAEAAITRALAQDEDAADAYAVRTIIHVTRNERAQALRDADRAVQLAPNSSTALIAQSYARQAGFDLEGARESLRSAVEKNPNDALAYARLAEIELSFADYDRANEAARQATTLAPNLARTQTVLGFSKLAEIDTDAARKAFARAIAQNSADPLPHLGFGLATIRDGFLEAGRRDLEIAASLDPNNALIRSYLGKAYFEEKRGPKDATQFDLAKKLDPNDPTPWFYDAIRKQTENRPVEALRDLEKAIELNDNRAVYRSSLLLDRDRAARGVSLARVYDDLGFEQLAVRLATKSISLDPTNHSAHRFLSDAYARRPEHEIARLSLLRTAKLLQTSNFSPVLPTQTATDLNIVTNIGPQSVSNNEFNSLFERDGLRLHGLGFIGNNSSWGEELAVNMISNSLSISAGQFKSDTDGFRKNFGIENEIYNIFAQLFVSKNLNIQAEYTGINNKNGDINLQFDPDVFSDRDNNSLSEDNFRIGAAYRFNTANTMLLSVQRNNSRTNNQRFIDTISFGTIVDDVDLDEKGSQIEIQNIFSKGNSSSIIGFGYTDFSADRNINTISNIGDFLIEEDLNSENFTIYYYQYFSPIDNFSVDFGLSYDNLEEENFDVKQFNPKLGIQWAPFKWAQIRAAAFQSVKRQFILDTTLEPTQVAGFNQYRDDFNLTESNFYGLGFDFDIAWGANVGAEIFRRDSKVPTSTGSIDQRVDNAHLYYYQPIGKRFSLTVEPELEYTNFDAPSTNVPQKIRNVVLPVGIRYFGVAGLIAGLEVNFVHQRVNQLEVGGASSRLNENFFTVDANAGWRDPKGNYLFELEARNIFDQNFNFRDQNFRTFRERSARFIPDATFLAKLTVSF